MATDTLTTPPTLSYGKTKVFKNFIDGEWVEASTGETFENRNPADTRDLVGIFQKSAKADVDTAVAAAKRAFAKWRLVPAPRRAEMVFRAAEILIERKEDYARDMTREMGKVLPRRAGTCRKPLTLRITTPARDAVCSVPPCPRKCPTSSRWPYGSLSACAA